VHCERICTDPSAEVRRQIPLPEVLHPHLNILLFAGEAVVFAETLPAIWPVVALGGAVRLVGAGFGELAGGLVDGERFGVEVIGELEENVEVGGVVVVGGSAAEQRLAFGGLFVVEAREAHAVGGEVGDLGRGIDGVLFGDCVEGGAAELE